MDELEEIFDDSNEIESSLENSSNYELERITLKHILLSVLAILNFEKGILFTIKELVLRPRIVIEEYLKKDRKKLIHPIRFLVFSTALSAFLSLTIISNNPELNTVQLNMEDGFKEGWEMREIENRIDTLKLDKVEFHLSHSDSVKLKKKNERKAKMKNFGKQVQKLTANNSDKFTFAIVLFYSFFTFLFFKKNGYNFTENLVINSYMSSINNVFSIIILIPALFTGDKIYMIIATVVPFIFTIYFWVSTYQRKTIGGVFRSLLVFLTSYFVFIITIGKRQ